MHDELTEDQAKALYDSEWWMDLSAREITEFQLFTSRLCMPWGTFQQAVEEALGRPVWTHEFANADRLQAEFLGQREAPSFEDTMALVPAEKRVLIIHP